MPNTLIREGYLDSDRISALSDFDDRVFFRLLLAADDAGRTDGRADKLRSTLFPTRECVRSAEIEKSIGRLAAADLLTRWEYDGKSVIQIRRWQRRSGAQFSRYPDPKGSFKIVWVKVQTRDGDQSFSSTSMNPSDRVTEPIDNPSEGDSRKSTYTNTDTETGKGGESSGFEKFWEQWPQHKRKDGKKQALAHWRSAELEGEAEKILACLSRWKGSEDWTKKGGEFIPAPLPWLRKENWRTAAPPPPPMNGEGPTFANHPGNRKYAS